MASTVTTTIVVEFGSSEGANGILQAEVDNRPVAEGGLNPSTSFSAGSPVYILVYYTPNVTGLSALVSAGTIAIQSARTRSITEYIQFVNTNTSSVAYPIDSIQAVQWQGNNLGAISSLGGKDVKSSNSGVGIAKITYTTKFRPFRLSPPTLINGSNSFTILIYISGTVT